MAFSLTQIATDMISTAGYGGLALGLIVDSAGIPIPSEVLVPLATVLAKEGRFNLVAVVAVSVAAQVAGGLIAYEIGRRGGLPFIHRYGKYFFVSNRELSFTHRQFERRGYVLALAGRCLPVIRGYIGFVAGIAEMPRQAFITATLIGSLLWTLILTAAGLLLAKNIEVIDQTLRPFSVVIIGVILVSVVWYLIYHWNQHRRR
jgi:membrane protein DedA with SNARE-associated domain